MDRIIDFLHNTVDNATVRNLNKLLTVPEREEIIKDILISNFPQLVEKYVKGMKGTN